MEIRDPNQEEAVKIYDDTDLIARTSPEGWMLVIDGKEVLIKDLIAKLEKVNEILKQAEVISER